MRKNPGITYTVYEGRLVAMTRPRTSRMSPRVVGRSMRRSTLFSAISVQRSASITCT
jgi:hypothetical protein